MIAVEIEDVPEAEDLIVGTPRFLFEKAMDEFTVMPDGQSFVVNYDEAAAPDHLILVQNWTEELKRLE